MSSQNTDRIEESSSPSDNAPADDLKTLSKQQGNLSLFFSTLLKHLTQTVSQPPETQHHCALCPDLILPTQPAKEDEEGEPVHEMCLEMKLKREALLQSVSDRIQPCPLCYHRVSPQEFFCHEGGLTISYTCSFTPPQSEHGEPHHFSFLLDTSESRWIGTWEARLRQRFKDKGYIICCECGHRIQAEKAQSLGAGWHYCGCMPELWNVGP